MGAWTKFADGKRRRHETRSLFHTRSFCFDGREDKVGLVGTAAIKRSFITLLREMIRDGTSRGERAGTSCFRLIVGSLSTPGGTRGYLYRLQQGTANPKYLPLLQLGESSGARTTPPRFSAHRRKTGPIGARWKNSKVIVRACIFLRLRLRGSKSPFLVVVTESVNSTSDI